MPQRQRAKLPNTARASVSFPEDIYREIEQIALNKKVSVAWVVRDAVERYVADQARPLRTGPGKK